MTDCDPLAELGIDSAMLVATLRTLRPQHAAPEPKDVSAMSSTHCPIHETMAHSLEQCHAVNQLVQERRRQSTVLSASKKDAANATTGAPPPAYTTALAEDLAAALDRISMDEAATDREAPSRIVAASDLAAFNSNRRASVMSYTRNPESRASSFDSCRTFGSMTFGGAGAGGDGADDDAEERCMTPELEEPTSAGSSNSSASSNPRRQSFRLDLDLDFPMPPLTNPMTAADALRAKRSSTYHDAMQSYSPININAAAQSTATTPSTPTTIITTPRTPHLTLPKMMGQYPSPTTTAKTFLPGTPPPPSHTPLPYPTRRMSGRSVSAGGASPLTPAPRLPPVRPYDSRSPYQYNGFAPEPPTPVTYTPPHHPFLPVPATPVSDQKAKRASADSTATGATATAGQGQHPGAPLSSPRLSPSRAEREKRKLSITGHMAATTRKLSITPSIGASSSTTTLATAALPAVPKGERAKLDQPHAEHRHEADRGHFLDGCPVCDRMAEAWARRRNMVAKAKKGKDGGGGSGSRSAGASLKSPSVKASAERDRDARSSIDTTDSRRLSRTTTAQSASTTTLHLGGLGLSIAGTGSTPALPPMRTTPSGSPQPHSAHVAEANAGLYYADCAACARLAEACREGHERSPSGGGGGKKLFAAWGRKGRRA